MVEVYDPELTAEKLQLAIENAQKSNPHGGLCGFELEWNLLDARMSPLLTVGVGRNQKSFVDYLRAEHLAGWASEYSQLEVFHWMIEWATRPYYSPRAAVYEARLMEAMLLDGLHSAGRQFGERLYLWHGNLLYLTDIGHDSIPGSWHLAKRRYLERCVDLYGAALATAGTHSNLSLPDPLFTWDFIHISPTERGDNHLDQYKSEFYITATRLMRAFAAMFIATSASTPLQAQTRDGQPVVRLTEFDSIRNLTFPNPPELDLPDLYRSYRDYLRLSYDLVRRGVRFGNNNWTPVRARSFADPVERLIAVTSEQLNELYSRGLYAIGDAHPIEEMASKIEIQNLMARINLPMARVEVRTDDGGNPLDIEVANITLKFLLLVRFYADPLFGRSFRYDAEDIARARRNEDSAARYGLRAEIENPLSAKPIAMRDFLAWMLEEIHPLAKALGLWEDLTPLVEMSRGGTNAADRLRERLNKELKGQSEVPLELLAVLAEERQSQVLKDVEAIAETYSALRMDAPKLGEFIQRARDDVRHDPTAPIRFRPRPQAMVEMVYPDKTAEIVDLAKHLIRIPSVTACPNERLDEVHRAATFIFDYARNHGIGVRYYDQEKYPALLVGFPGQMAAPVMLSGHVDVVTPDPDDSQFEPRVEGEYLWGRGAADMKTVLATYLVWLKDVFNAGPPYPPINLMLVGNEENGESEPMGTPHLLNLLHDEERDAQDQPYEPLLFIAGERTGERGNEIWGEVCTQNRGVMRFQVAARDLRMHTGTAANVHKPDLSERMVAVRQALNEILDRRLTISSPDGWQSQVRYPFLHVGEPGVYNISPDYGILGVEVRPIPQDDTASLREELQAYCQANRLELFISVMEEGVVCSTENPFLQQLLEAVRRTSGQEPAIGRKLPGTSARFAPKGQGLVWGQSGIGPHARDERHFIPSIAPYYQALNAYKDLLINNLSTP